MERPVSPDAPMMTTFILTVVRVNDSKPSRVLLV